MARSCKMRICPVCCTMKRRPLPSAAEVSSSGAVNPLATVVSLTLMDPRSMSGTGGVGVGVGVLAVALPVSDRKSKRNTTAAVAVTCDILRKTAVMFDLLFDCM